MKNTDIIYINDLIVPCIVGAFEHERGSKQNVTINLSFAVDTKKAGKSDDLKDTVSYHDIAHNVHEMVTQSSYHLLEALAQSVADICLQDKRIQQITVSIEKPKAVKIARSAAISITRSNE